MKQSHERQATNKVRATSTSSLEALEAVLPSLLLDHWDLWWHQELNIENLYFLQNWSYLALCHGTKKKTFKVKVTSCRPFSTEPAERLPMGLKTKPTHLVRVNPKLDIPNTLLLSWCQMEDGRLAGRVKVNFKNRAIQWIPINQSTQARYPVGAWVEWPNRYLPCPSILS